MALTNAEKQARYRAARPFASENGERRIASWVKSGTSFSLERLARHFDLTQREVLENIIESATKAATARMTDDERDHFYREREFKLRTRKESIVTE